MRRRLSLTFGSWILGILASSSAQAFTYEVLFDETLSRDAATLGRSTYFASSFKSVLLDGKVENTGTDAVTYDRLLINSLRVLQQFSMTPNLGMRLLLPVTGTFEKQESRDEPKNISEATWGEAKPRVEIIYATQNALDFVLGLNFHFINAYTQKTDTPNFTASDHYAPLSMNYFHLALVKHAPTFDGGFSYQGKAERGRKLTKSTSLGEDPLELEDRVYTPTTIAIFANVKQSFGNLYGEFAAIEASGGGNRTEDNVGVREDYFRIQFTGLFPLGGKDLQLESSLLYKSLSYASNTNVTLDTIPMLGLHLKLHFQLGLPMFAGLIGVRGSDGQSLQEFNANYRIVGIGAVAGLSTVL